MIKYTIRKKIDEFPTQTTIEELTEKSQGDLAGSSDSPPNISIISSEISDPPELEKTKTSKPKTKLTGKALKDYLKTTTTDPTSDEPPNPNKRLRGSESPQSPETAIVTQKKKRTGQNNVTLKNLGTKKKPQVTSPGHIPAT